MKKLSMMWTLLAVVLLSVVGCKNTEPEPVAKPTISVAEAVVNAETMTASVEVTPSANTNSWSWKVDTAEAAGEYTTVTGHDKKTIEVAVEYDTEYTFTAYATNLGGNSQEVSVSFQGPEAPVVVPPTAASIEVGEVEVNAETLKAVVTVTPSENTAKWYYALKSDATEEEPTYTEVEGNEAKTLSLDIEPNTTYILIVYAVNEEGEACEKATTTFEGPAKSEEEPSGNGELVKLELKNITALSVDADVLKYKECVRYVAGAMFSEAYNENRFISTAKTSLNPNESYPYVQYNSATTSKVWTEMDLLKNGLITKPENDGVILIAGQSYTVAVYAEDAEGNYKVYTEAFTAPTATIDGTVKVGLTIDNVGMTDVTATFTTDSECRIITGTRLAVNSQDGFDVNSMSAEEIKTYLASNAAAVPHIITGTETTKFTADLGVDIDYIVYAIAIKDGKIGDVVYEKFHTKRPELTGKGAITAATFEAEQEDIYALNYTLTTNADTKKVRVFFSSDVDYHNNIETLDFIMVSEEASYMWEEYDVVDGKVEISSEIYKPGLAYAVIAMPFDADGNPGQLYNCVKLWDSSKEFYQSKEEGSDAADIDMTGTGEVTMVVKEGGVSEEVAAAVVTVGEKSDNVKQAWLLYFNEEMENNIENAVVANLQEWDGTTESIIGAVKEVTFAEGEQFAYESMIPYSSGWGGTVIVALTLDTDGKFNIADYYLAGTGDKNTEAPATLTPTGDATINVKEVSNADGMTTAKVQVTQVNTEFEFGWVLRLSDDTKESEISDKVYAAFEEFGSTGIISGSYKEITFGEVVEYQSLINYSEEWGGNILAVVGLSADGTPILADYYLAGSGDKGTVTEGGDEPEPTDVFPALYKGATLSLVSEDTTDDVNASATLKVSDIPAGYTAWLFNLGQTAKPANVMTTIAAKFEDGLPSESNANRKVEAGSENSFTNLATEWDGEMSVIALVLVDAENTPWVVAAYACGKGVSPEGTLEIGQGGGDDPVVEHKPAMAVVSENVTDPASASVTLSVNGIGTGYTGWLINLGSEALIDEVDSKVAALFADGTPTASAMGAYRTVENGSESTFQYMMTYHPTYGGNIIAFVTVDAQGNASVVNYYVCGEGLAGGTTTEAPAMALVSEDVAAGTATFTVSNLPAEGTAWLLNLGDDAQPNEVSSKVALLFADGDPIATENGAYRKVAEGTEYTYNGMLPYEEQYGGNIIVLVVVKDGVPTVYNYYTCGVGMSGSESEDDGEDVEFGGGTPSIGEVGDDVIIGGDVPTVD